MTEVRNGRVGQVEWIISTILRAGVLLSLALIVLGTLISFTRHPEFFHSRETYQRLVDGRGEYPHSLETVLAGARDFRGRAWIMAGLLLLIATPVLRVAFSVMAFVQQRDRAFVAITLLVLAMLLASFFLGRVTGG